MSREYFSDAAEREVAELRSLTADELRQYAMSNAEGEPSWWAAKARTAPRPRT